MRHCVKVGKWRHHCRGRKLTQSWKRTEAQRSEIRGIGFDIGTARSASSYVSHDGLVHTHRVLTDLPVIYKREVPANQNASSHSRTPEAAAVSSLSWLQRWLEPVRRAVQKQRGSGSAVTVHDHEEADKSVLDAIATVACSLCEGALDITAATDARAHAVIALPSGFSTSQNNAVVQAVESALPAVQVDRVIREPIAAAVACGFGTGKGSFSEEQAVLVFDLGAGTADCAVVDVGRGVYEEIAQAGDTALGGVDFDTRIAFLILQRAGASAPESELGHDLLTQARQVKEAACSEGSCTCEYNNISITLTESDISVVCADLVHRCSELVQQTLASAMQQLWEQEGRDGLDGAVVVGGGANMRAVVQAVEAAAGMGATWASSDESTVAQGAAILAGVTAGAIERNDAITLDEGATSDDMAALLTVIEELEQGHRR